MIQTQELIHQIHSKETTHQVRKVKNLDSIEQIDTYSIRENYMPRSSPHSYLDDNFLDKNLLDMHFLPKRSLINKTVKINKPSKLSIAIKTFGSKHPTFIIVTIVQFYLIIVMALLHSDLDLVLFTFVMMLGYIMGGVAVIMDHSNSEYKTLAK